MLQTATIGVDQLSESQLQLTALLQHLQHVGQRAEKGLQVV